jgi:restriction endonuclease S subunit
MSEAVKKMKPGWKLWHFDEIATNVNDRIDNPSESGLEYYVGLEHLDPGTLKISRWGSPDDVEATKLIFKKGDVIFGRRRAYQRKLGVAEFDGICSAHAMVLRAKSEIVLPRFLPFFLQSDLFMSKALEISVGSLSPTINWKSLAVQQFALPPIDEQERLIKVLESIECVLHAHEALALHASELTRSRIEDFFCSRDAFSEVAIGDVADLITKGESPHWQGFGYVEEGIPFITSENVLDGTLAMDPAKYIDDDFHKKLRRSVIFPGDVLINIVGASIGRACVVPSNIREANTNQAVAIVRLNANNVIPDFFLLHFRWPKFQQTFLGKQVNTARANISLTNIREARILLPSIRAQESLVQECAAYQMSVSLAQQRRESGNRLKESVLAGAFGNGNVY